MQKFVICPQSGYTIELAKLMEAGKLLMEMGYDVRRVKVRREGQKTAVNALEIAEQPAETKELK